MSPPSAPSRNSIKPNLNRVLAVTRSAKLFNLASLLLIICAGVLGYHVWQGQSNKDSAVEPAEVPARPPPTPAPGAALPAPSAAPVAIGRHWLKCVAVHNFTGHQSQGQPGFDTDPCGWKEATVNGTKRWYRLFVQTTITSNAVVDGGNGAPETQLVFTARGRHAAVPCKGQYDMVPAPKDDTVGTGYDAWSEWHEWKRTAAVSCDGEAGAITTHARDEHGMAGDDFSDGFLLTTKLAEGAGESVSCTAISTHPLGGNGDEERAWVRFAAVSR